MSATRDKNQKVAFVYSNLYQLYKKGKEAASAADVSEASQASQDSVAQTSVQTSQVLKVGNLKEPTFAQIKVSSYSPTEFITKRIENKPAVLKEVQKVTPQQNFVRPMSVENENPVIESLKQNLKSLNDLHSRLKFMLQELEDLVKE